MRLIIFLIALVFSFSQAYAKNAEPVQVAGLFEAMAGDDVNLNFGGCSVSAGCSGGCDEPGSSTTDRSWGKCKSNPSSGDCECQKRCNQNSDCANSSLCTCDNGTCNCVECNSDTDCGSGEKCFNNNCRTPFCAFKPSTNECSNHCLSGYSCNESCSKCEKDGLNLLMVSALLMAFFFRRKSLHV